MRKVRITTQNRNIEAEDNTILMCPVRSDGKATFACTDKCAWFEMDEKAVALCGLHEIGEIQAKEEK